MRFVVNSFIATLGSGTLLLGLSQWYTGGRLIVESLPSHSTALSGRLLDTGIPAPPVYVVAIAVVLWIVFDYLPIGRFLYVTGEAPRAAELNAIPVGFYITLAFIASGVLSAIAGVVIEAQMQVGQSTVGQELMLPAFTGALLGTTATRPGRPKLSRLLALAVAFAVAGLTQLGAPFYVENLFNGAMLVRAVSQLQPKGTANAHALAKRISASRARSQPRKG